jgi:hypothetical protein
VTGSYDVLCLAENGEWLAPPAWQGLSFDAAYDVFNDVVSHRFYGIRVVGRLMGTVIAERYSQAAYDLGIA